MQPLEVVLHEGEALVWFPGWLHETKILKGLSISLSLHFQTIMNSLYVKTFKAALADQVSPEFMK